MTLKPVNPLALQSRATDAPLVRLVWYVDPEARTVQVFTSATEARLLRESDTLDGGDVLPGFVLPLRELFAEPLAEPPGGAGEHP